MSAGNIKLDRLMIKNISGKCVSFFALGVSALVLSGCIGGTTYGTGVTQEQQLVNDVRGMVSLGKTNRSKTRIDYSARPDLVLPGQTTSLPAPQEQVSSSSNVDWPESPEQKIAKIRAAAAPADSRSGEVPISELLRKKEGIRIAARNANYLNSDKDGHDAITNIGINTRKNAARLKQQNSLTSGTTIRSRKYLTEPPVEYRIPASSAPSGDLGVSEAEKDRRIEKAAKDKFQDDTGMWTGN